MELKLDDLYVPLTAEAPSEADNAPEDGEDSKPAGLRTGSTAGANPISLRDLLAQGNHLIVTGAAGCGKTTVLQHIAWTLAEALRTGNERLATDRLGLTGPLPLPIYLPLSLYGEHRRKFADDPDRSLLSLPTYIKDYLLERQAALRLPPDFFAAVLDQGKDVLLLLDGLDEVANEELRVDVSQAVQGLCSGRKHARFVVTCRTAAYSGRSLLLRPFQEIKVDPLSPELVAELIGHAYRARYPKPTDQDRRDREAAELIASVERLEAARAGRLGDSEEARLVTTPLMVRMILIVRINRNRELPDQRAELYSEVVSALVTASYSFPRDENAARQVRQIGGDPQLRLDMCQHLAFELHGRGKEAGRDIEEQELKDLLCRYLTERRKKSQEDATRLVDDFVLASRQRGGLLQVLAGYYRFTHLSFQEFLVARYLAEVERAPEKIAAYLAQPGQVLDPWWREPALLTAGYLTIPAEELSEPAAALIRGMACLDDENPPVSAESLGAAELAATSFLEWRGDDATRRQLAQRLSDLLRNASIGGAPPRVRASAGRALARVGDPCCGVGLNAAGLPDIAWSAVIPPGEFIMGNTQETDDMAYPDEAPPHPERIAEPYRISVYPITNEQYGAFMRGEGYRDADYWNEARTAGRWKDGRVRRAYVKGVEGDKIEWAEEWADAPASFGSPFDLPNHPVVGMCWYEVLAFCRWLSEKSGQKIELPTEAQWERAARGLDGRRYPWVGDITPDHANYEMNVGTTTAVGVFPKGKAECGALDMSGNAWEWCRTKWRGNYDTPPDDDPAEEALRVLRGGSSFDGARLVRCAYRGWNYPYVRLVYLGFRVVVSPSGSGLWPL